MIVRYLYCYFTFSILYNDSAVNCFDSDSAELGKPVYFDKQYKIPGGGILGGYLGGGVTRGWSASGTVF